MGQVGLEEKAYVAGVWFEGAVGFVPKCLVAMHILAKCSVIPAVMAPNLFQVIKDIFIQLE